MEFKKTGAEQTTITRDVKDIVDKTGNVYQSLSILVKRSEQISEKMKTELLAKLNEFATHSEELEEDENSIKNQDVGHVALTNEQVLR